MPRQAYSVIDNGTPRWDFLSGLDASVGVVNVRDYGATGDGTTDDRTAIQNAADAAFGNAFSPHGLASVYSNRVLYFPPGDYRLNSQVNFGLLVGARIIGAGTHVTRLNGTGKVFSMNGCAYSHFEGLALESDSTTVAVVDLDWNNDSGGLGLQSNTFLDCYFTDGKYGVVIGESGFMGSENVFINCFFFGAATAGLAALNSNALTNVVYGGNFQNCAIGVLVVNGSIPLISGCGFQNSTSWDIQQQNSALDTNVITGCRSESVNFANFNHQLHAATVIGCSHLNATNGKFIQLDNHASVVVDSCNVGQGGQFDGGGNGRITIRNSRFRRTAWLVAHGSACYVDIENCDVAVDDNSPEGIRIVKQRRFVHPTASNNVYADYNTSLPVVGITASTTDAQGEGPLTGEINRVDTVANLNDVVTLPDLQETTETGLKRCVLINRGGNQLKMYPAAGQDLGQGTNIADFLADNGQYEFLAMNNTTWIRKL